MDFGLWKQSQPFETTKPLEPRLKGFWMTFVQRPMERPFRGSRLAFRSLAVPFGASSGSSRGVDVTFRAPTVRILPKKGTRRPSRRVAARGSSLRPSWPLAVTGWAFRVFPVAGLFLPMALLAKTDHRLFVVEEMKSLGAVPSDCRNM